MGLREGSSIGHRILCLHISSGTRIRATVVRLTHAKQHNIQTSKGGKHGARQPLDGITSASEPKYVQNGKRGARLPITGLTSASEPKTHSKRQTWSPTANPGLTSASEPKHHQITSKHTQKRKRLPGVVSHDHLPTYLVWNEDQGDVVPLKGTKLLTRNRGKTHN